MKNIIAILLFSFISLSINAQYGVDNIFRKYKNDKGVMAWQFDGEDLASMLPRIDDKELKSTIVSVDFVLFANEGDITDKDKKKLTVKIEAENYEILIQARDQGQNIKVFGIEEGDTIKKVFAQMKVNKMNAYFFLTGEIFLEDLQSMNFEGLMNGINIGDID